jgi:hypothetical protein
VGAKLRGMMSWVKKWRPRRHPRKYLSGIYLK